MKKVLSIVLSLAMVVCLMPTMAFATEAAGPATSADYTDASDITYTEAVDVLTAIGVLNGVNDGSSFDPKSNVTRESAAKIICTMLLGGKADRLTTTTAPFDDVAANRWSAPYVAYCAETNIVAGDGSGNFNPEDNVTALQFAKMLLVTLGYNDRVEGLLGSSWAIKTSALSAKINLFAGNEDVDQNAATTREETALYAFNTLSANMVEYTTPGTEVTMPDGSTIVVGSSPATAVTRKSDAVDNIGEDSDDSGLGVIQFAEQYFPKLKLKTETEYNTDTFGRPGATWTLNNDIVTFRTDTPALTYENEWKSAEDVKTALALRANGTSQTINVYVDGNTTGIPIDNRGAGDAGSVVEIYKTSNSDGDIYKVFEINTYLAQVTTVNEETDEDARSVVFKAVGNDLNYDTPYSTEQFEEGDYVLVTGKVDNTGAETTISPVTVIPVENVIENVAVTGYRWDSVTAGDETYTYNGTYRENATNNYVMGEGTTYNLYLDEMGNVVFVDRYTGETTNNYVYVLHVSQNPLGDSVYGTYRSVQYVDTTGAESFTKAMDVDRDGNGTIDNDDKMTENSWYMMSDDPDNEGFNLFTSQESVNIEGITKLGRTVADLGTTSGNVTVRANADTIFVLQTGDDEYKAYTGLADLPSYTFTDGVTGNALTDDNDYAKEVFINVTSGDVIGAATGEVIYLFDKDSDGTEYDSDSRTNVSLFDAVVGGEKSVIKVKAAKASSMMEDLNNGLCEVTYDANGLVTKLVEVTSETADAKGYKVGTYDNGEGSILCSKSTLTISGFTGADGTYVLADDVAIYQVTSTTTQNVKTILPQSLSGLAKDNHTIYLVPASADDATIIAVYYVQTA